MRAITGLTSLSLFALCAALTGCTLSNTATPVVTTSSVMFRGSVYGGSLPIVGAHVYFFAANTTALAGPGIAPSAANSSVSLLKAASNTAEDVNGNYYVVTGSDGSFTITGDYTTCTPGEQLYLYTSGGTTAGVTNPLSGLMADIGGCTATYPNASTTVHINEMSTLAAAYSLAGFASDATHISDDEAVTANTSAAFAQTGLANAFANAANMVTLSSAAPLATTPGGNGAIPTLTLNTIADLLADCVQSAGIVSPTCSDLFTFTGTPTTSDTATAAIKLAQNPAGVVGNGISVTTLFNSMPPNLAYNPTLPVAPNDFSIAIVFSGPHINAPDSITADSQGSLWISDNGNSYITKLNGSGAAYTESDYTDSSLAQPIGIAIDTNGNAWVANNGDNSATEFSGSGTTYTAHSYTGGTLNLNYSVAVDGNNNVFYPDLVPSGVTEFSGSGTTYVATQFNNSGSFPWGIAVDAGNNFWTTDGVGNSVTEYHYSSGTYTPVTFSDTVLSDAYAIGFDAAGSAWVAGYGSNSLTRFAGSGVTFLSTSFTGGGLNAPEGVAVDGAGVVWLANNTGKSISAFSNAGVALSPSTGYTGSTAVTGTTSDPLAGPTGIAVDSSGNVWVSDSSNSAVEYVGAASPVVLPLASAAHLNKLGTRP